MKQLNSVTRIGIAVLSFVPLGYAFWIFVTATPVDVPYLTAIPGEDLDPSLLRWLKRQGMLPPDESVQWLCSSGSWREASGCFFTEERVVDYFEFVDYFEIDGYDWVEVSSATWDEIVSIEWEHRDRESPVLEVLSRDNKSFYLWLPYADRGEQLFYDNLVALWEAGRGDSGPRGNSR